MRLEVAFPSVNREKSVSSVEDEHFSTQNDGPMMLRRFVRHTKNDPLVDEVHLMDINTSYAHFDYPDGRESTVYIKDLSACPAPPIAVDRDTTSSLSHMNNAITTNNQTPLSLVQIL